MKKNLVQRSRGLCEANVNVSERHGYMGCPNPATLEVVVPKLCSYVFPQGFRVCEEHRNHAEHWWTPVETRPLT